MSYLFTLKISWLIIFAWLGCSIFHIFFGVEQLFTLLDLEWIIDHTISTFVHTFVRIFMECEQWEEFVEFFGICNVAKKWLWFSRPLDDYKHMFCWTPQNLSVHLLSQIYVHYFHIMLGLLFRLFGSVNNNMLWELKRSTISLGCHQYMLCSSHFCSNSKCEQSWTA